MAINCKLNRDIAVGSGIQGDGCNSVSINAGLADGLYIFNLEDVKNLIFENDSRPDQSLYIDTIVTSQPYYKVDATNISYTQEYDDHSYTHQLTAQIKNVSNEIEEILESAVHGKYLVAIRVIGEKNYRLIGWKEGLSLDEELSISKEDNSFSLTFDGRTTYPEMECDKSNFDLANKVFDPSFEPLFVAGKVTCENGWAVANYVVKVNAAGQALDEDNKLVQYSGKNQDAYKLEGASDGNYNIIGTYASTDYIEGKAVKIYDTTLCYVACSISINPSTINFNSTTTSATFTITSSNDWEIVSYPSTVTLSQTYGTANDRTVWVYTDGQCGGETLTFRNRVGGCTATLGVSNASIKINSIYYYPNRTHTMTLYPIVCGDYTATVSDGNVIVNEDGSFTVSDISGSDNRKVVTVTLTNSNETKVVTLVIYGIDNSRGRRAISEYCETI